MSARDWNTQRNDAGFHIRTWANVEIEAPGNMGVAHRDHMIRLVSEYAKTLSLRMVIREREPQP